MAAVIVPVLNTIEVPSDTCFPAGVAHLDRLSESGSTPVVVLVMVLAVVSREVLDRAVSIFSWTKVLDSTPSRLRRNTNNLLL